MDLQKMLSQLSPEQLQQGMKQLGLTSEQMNMVNNKINTGANGGTNNIDANDINAFLKDNPNLAKQLQQANMMNKIAEIFKK